jgi:hypothetical protein
MAHDLLPHAPLRRARRSWVKCEKRSHILTHAPLRRARRSWVRAKSVPHTNTQSSPLSQKKKKRNSVMGRYTTARSFDDRSTEVQAAPTEEQKAAAGKKDILEVSVRAPKRKWRPCQREDARARSARRVACYRGPLHGAGRCQGCVGVHALLSGRGAVCIMPCVCGPGAAQ